MRRANTSPVVAMNLASLSEVSLMRTLGSEYLAIIERSFSTKVHKNKIGEFGSLLPTIKTGCLHSLRKPTDKILLTNLKLAVHDREQILLSDLTSVDPKMAGYLIIQSCCCIFVNPVDYFSMDLLRAIFDQLSNALFWIQKEESTILQIFLAIYSKLPFLENIEPLLPSVDKFIALVAQLPSECMSVHVAVCCALLDRLLEGTPSKECTDTFQVHVITIIGCLMKESGLVLELSDLFGKVVALFRTKEQQDEVSVTFLRLCLEFMKSCNTEFPELFELVQLSIKDVVIPAADVPKIEVVNDYMDSVGNEIVSDWVESTAPQLSMVFNTLLSPDEETNVLLLKTLVDKGCVAENSHNLTLQALIIIIMQYANIKNESLRSIVSDSRLLNILFAGGLFRSDVTIFTYPSSPVVTLRTLTIRVLSAHIGSSVISTYMMNCFCRIAAEPELFAEFFYMTYPILPQMDDESIMSFIEYMSHALIYQNEVQVKKKIVHIMVMRLFSIMLEEKRCRDFAAQSELLCTTLFTLFNDEPIAIQPVIDPLLPYCLDVTLPFFKQMMVFLSKNTLSVGAFECILMMIHRDVQNNNQKFANHFASSPLVPMILSIMNKFRPLTERLVVSTLLMLSALIRNDNKYLTSKGTGATYWNYVKPVIIDFDYSEVIYDCLCGIISCSAVNHGIASSDMLPVVETLLQTKYSTNFLKLVKEYTERSTIQSFILHDMNFLSLIVDLIIGDGNEEDINYAIDIFVSVSSYICTRQLMFKTIQALKPINNETEHNPKAKHVFGLLQRIAQQERKKETVSDIMIFKSSLHSITLPVFSMKDFPEGFVMSCWIKVPFMIANYIPLLSFVGPESDITYELNMKGLTINQDYCLYFEVPCNKWINLTMSCKNMGDVVFFMNGKQVGSVLSGLPDVNPVTSVTMFYSSGMLKSCCMFAGCAIWPGDLDQAVLDDIMDTPIDQFDTVAERHRMSMMYTTKVVQKERLVNQCETIFGDATSCCDYYMFVRDFIQVFESSKGLQFMLSLYTYAQFPNDRNTQNNSFVCELTKTIFHLLAASEGMQKVMDENNGFGIMAHFFATLTCEFRNEALWNSLMEVELNTTIDHLRREFYHNILFDMRLWIHGDMRFILVIAMHWNVIAVLSDQRLFKHVSSERIWDAIYCLSISKKLNDEDLLDQLQILLKIVARMRLTKEDIEIAIDLIEMNEKNPNVILMLLEVLGECESGRDAITRSLMSCETVVRHLDIRIRHFLIAKFVKHNINFLNEMLLLMIKELPDLEKDYINGIAKSICGDLDDLLVPVAIILSFYCDNEISEMIREKICRGLATGSLWIGSDTSPFHLLILILRVATGWGDLGTQISSIIGGNFEKLEQVLSAIDLVEATVPYDDEIVTTFLIELLTRVTQQGVQCAADFFENLTDFLFYGIKQTSRLETLDISYVVEKFVTSSLQPEVGLKTHNGKMRHHDVAMIFVQSLLVEIQASGQHVPLIMYIYIYYLYNDYPNIATLFMNSSDVDMVRMAPLFLKYENLREKYGAELTSEVMEQALQTMEEFYARRRPMTVLKDEIADLVFVASSGRHAMIAERFEENRIHLSRYWKKLWNSLAHERSPFITMKESVPHFKRGLMCDSFFRPTVLIRNNYFTDHKNPDIAHMYHFGDSNNEYSRSVVLWSTECELVRIAKTRCGRFCIIPEGFTFTYQQKCRFIAGEDVEYVFKFWTDNQPTGFQIFTRDHRMYLFRVTGENPHAFIWKLRNISLPNLKFFHDDTSEDEVENLKLTQKWRNNDISTMKYLTWLNLLAGRSFHDIDNYPVFPNVLADIDSETLDLEDPSSYRDLSQPGQSVLTPEFIPHVLVRLEPFTTRCLHQHEEKFEPKDILFKSVSELNKSASTLPDLYFCSDFLTNKDNFDIGEANVLLPKWAHTPEQFVTMQRKALESDYVSESLHSWIDNTWGVGAEDHDNKQLFTSPHPTRTLALTGVRDSEVIVLQNIVAPVISCKPIGKEFDTMKVFSLLENGLVVCLRFVAFNFEMQPNDSSKFRILTNNSAKIQFMKGSSSSFAFASDKSSSLCIFNSTDRTIIRCQSSPHLSEITCIAVSDEFLVTGGADACYAIWKWESNDIVCKNYLLAHRDVVTCCYASDIYNVVVTCSKDSTMIVSLLPQLQLLRVVNLSLSEDAIPVHVLITQNHGIIMVLIEEGKKTIVKSFTINCDPIWDSYTDKRVTAVCTASRRDTDYFLFVEGGKTLVAYDAQTMKRVKVMWHYQGGLTRIDYHEESNHVVCTTGDQKIQFVPFFDA